MRKLLEICAGSLDSVLAAKRGGADRIELCDNLSEGGTTPSLGMIRVALSIVDIPVFPIIRPRGGNFVYSDAEFEAMKYDIAGCRDLGCRGIVTGFLLNDGRIDRARCAEVIKMAGPMQVTFHRAFDRCVDIPAALEEIIELGFARILSSGGRDSAMEGRMNLQALVQQASNRIIIMPGAGLDTGNLKQIMIDTKASEFHGTARNKISGEETISEEQDSGLFQTSAAVVQTMRTILNLQDR